MSHYSDDGVEFDEDRGSSSWNHNSEPYLLICQFGEQGKSGENERDNEKGTR